MPESKRWGGAYFAALGVCLLLPVIPLAVLASMTSEPFVWWLLGLYSLLPLYVLIGGIVVLIKGGELSDTDLSESQSTPSTDDQDRQ